MDWTEIKWKIVHFCWIPCNSVHSLSVANDVLFSLYNGLGLSLSNSLTLASQLDTQSLGQFQQVLQSDKLYYK
jgi:hypothetical protein